MDEASLIALAKRKREWEESNESFRVWFFGEERTVSRGEWRLLDVEDVSKCFYTAKV